MLVTSTMITVPVATAHIVLRLLRGGVKAMDADVVVVNHHLGSWPISVKESRLCRVPRGGSDDLR